MRESWELALMRLCCGPSSHGHGSLPLHNELDSQEHVVLKLAVTSAQRLGDPFPQSSLREVLPCPDLVGSFNNPRSPLRPFPFYRRGN